MSEPQAEVVQWVHDAMLSPTWLRAGVPAVFVFDEAWIAEERLSLKRIVFMAECLEQMPGVEVRRGGVVEEVSAFADARGAKTIVTQANPLPRIGRQVEALSGTYAVEAVEMPAFVSLSGRVDLKRFSRYWNKAKNKAFLPTDEQGGGPLFSRHGGM